MHPDHVCHLCGREHVAADNTDEVSEHDATGPKSLVLENGVAVMDLLLGVMRRIESTQCLWTREPQLRNSPRSIPGRAGSIHDCLPCSTREIDTARVNC
ncbi:hypothetical protein TcBrA4_0048800 [Trypanosoma cruzi]|nr:hypothetical protein TcBrA4_0048800 [Trypanosoma cruzi]